jgi:hypothetical protein
MGLALCDSFLCWRSRPSRSLKRLGEKGPLNSKNSTAEGHTFLFVVLRIMDNCLPVPYEALPGGWCGRQGFSEFSQGFRRSVGRSLGQTLRALGFSDYVVDPLNNLPVCLRWAVVAPGCADHIEKASWWASCCADHCRGSAPSSQCTLGCFLPTRSLKRIVYYGFKFHVPCRQFGKHRQVQRLK